MNNLTNNLDTKSSKTISTEALEATTPTKIYRTGLLFGYSLEFYGQGIDLVLELALRLAGPVNLDGLELN